MHKSHGDIHEIGVRDDCPACTEMANDPYKYMDHLMLQNLVARNYNYRFHSNVDIDERFQWSPRTNNEAIAMVNITNTMEKMGKLFEIDSFIMAQYLRERWHIDFEELI